VISRLPAWVSMVAFVLAAIAGIINVIGLLGFDHQAVTHMTGSTSILAEAVAAAEPSRALHILLIIVAFLAGTVISGCLIQDSTLQLGRRYGAALILESALLAGAMFLLRDNHQWGMYCAACACGLQNAMMTTYSGTIIRTTHISGMVTDLGIAFGHRLRGLPVDRRRVRLCISVISGFFVGGVGGAMLFERIGFETLWVPIVITAAGGIGYAGWRTANHFA